MMHCWTGPERWCLLNFQLVSIWIHVARCKHNRSCTHDSYNSVLLYFQCVIWLNILHVKEIKLFSTSITILLLKGSMIHSNVYWTVILLSIAIVKWKEYKGNFDKQDIVPGLTLERTVYVKWGFETTPWLEMELAWRIGIHDTFLYSSWLVMANDNPLVVYTSPMSFLSSAHGPIQPK